MSLLHFLVLFGLLQQLSNAASFTVGLTQQDITGFEGDVLDIDVRLEGQISAAVDVELELLTVSQFQTRPEASGYIPTSDPAEERDFGFDGELVHRFQRVSLLRQTATFNIDIVNDDKNEPIEEFIAVVNVDMEENAQDDVSYTRRYSTITILIDSANPDRTRLSISTQSGSTTVSEGTTGWSLSLTITAYPPENDIEISVGTDQTISHPAMPSSDYILLNSSVVLTLGVNNYSVFMNFIDDEIPEPEMEDVVITFTEVPSIDFNEAASITITIQDDDELLIGFTTMRLDIKEGRSDTAEIAILTEGEVAATVSGQMLVSSSGTAESEELPAAMSFKLTPQNRVQRFLIEIPNNDEVDTTNNGERHFTLKIAISGTSNMRRIDPRHLQVFIKDNDTEVEFGIRGGLTMQSVQEGSNITISVGFLGNIGELLLDDDFVVGFAVKLLYEDNSPTGGNATSADLVTTDIPNGRLTNIIRSKDITIATKSNEEVQENRQFTIVIEDTSADFNSPLVKLRAGVLSVIIDDNDIYGPNKPRVNVTPLTGDKEFAISWTVISNDLQPITSLRVEITYPDNTTTIITVPPRTTLTQHSYTINGVDYSTVNISVRVCAINNKAETCSDVVFHRGVVKQGGESPSDDGISGGAIAAIIIVLLLFCCISIPLVLLLIYLCRMYFWNNYYPVIREKKHAAEFALAREEFEYDA